MFSLPILAGLSLGLQVLAMPANDGVQITTSVLSITSTTTRGGTEYPYPTGYFACDGSTFTVTYSGAPPTGTSYLPYPTESSPSYSTVYNTVDSSSSTFYTRDTTIYSSVMAGTPNDHGPTIYSTVYAPSGTGTPFTRDTTIYTTSVTLNPSYPTITGTPVNDVTTIYNSRPIPTTCIYPTVTVYGPPSSGISSARASSSSSAASQVGGSALNSEDEGDDNDTSGTVLNTIGWPVALLAVTVAGTLF